MSEPNWLRELAARNADEYRRIPERIRAAAELEHRRRTSEAVKRNLGPTRQDAPPPPLGESSRPDDRLPVEGPPDRSADPLLAHLPDDMRAVAVEFLDLHEAWDTEFKAIAKATLFLDWAPGELEYARFKWSRSGGCSLSFADPVAAEYFSLRSNAVRRSSDFAEFVQRWRVG